MPRGQRTDLLKAAMVMELGDAGYGVTDIERRTGVNDSTVSGILSGDFGWGKIAERPVFREYREKQKIALQAASIELARKSLVQAEKELPKASYYQSVLGYAILRDKERLDAGESTQNIAVAFTPSTIDTIKEALKSRLEGCKQGEKEKG